MTKIAVVVTVYNQEQFIGKCLNSILQQTYREIEVIVVDDGSTDSSSVICDQYAEKDDRVLVIHQLNQGATMARLAGVKKACADYVTFVDGDDWIDEQCYEDIAGLNAFGKVDLIAFGMNRYYADGEVHREECIYDAGIYDRQKIADQIIPRLFWDSDNNTYGLDPSLCTKIFQRKKLERYIERLCRLKIHYGEDIAVLYPLFLDCSSFAVTDKCYYYHRIRKNHVVPPYIKDNMYYGKLYSLYVYLLEAFQGDKSGRQLIRQLDYFYIYSVRLSKIKYCDLVFEERYLFPFDRIPKGSRIVLYGAGQVGQTFYSQLQKLSYCEIVAWVDRDCAIYDNELIREIDLIRDMEYDQILIAIASGDIAVKAQESLVQMGVEPSKIIRYG